MLLEGAREFRDNVSRLPICLNEGINGLGKYEPGYLRKSHVPLVVALAHQDIDLIVGLLLRKAFLAIKMHDVLDGAYGVFLVVGEGVIVSDHMINNLPSLVHESRVLQ